MSDYKVGDKFIATSNLLNDYGCNIGDELTLIKICKDNCHVFKSEKTTYDLCFFMSHVKPLPSYEDSNRYRLHKAASATGFSFSKLSRAMGFSDTYISNESKESRFNRRGDLTDNRYNHLIDELAIAERTLKGDFAKVVDDSIDIETESLCIERRFELEPKEVTPNFTPKQKIKSKTEVNKFVVWFILLVLVVIILMLVAGIYKSIF